MPQTNVETETDVHLAGAGRWHDTERPDLHTASATYARRFGGRVGSYLLRRQDDGVRRLLRHAPRGPLKVLCVGGGHGQLTDLLLAGGHEITVHGSAIEAIGSFSATKRIASADPHRCVSSLWQLPFADERFDLVVGIRLLAHVARWRELLAEIARVSRDLILVDYPRAGGVQRLADRLFVLKRRVEASTRPYFCYMDRQIVGALRAAGLAPVASDGQFVLPMALHRLMRAPRISSAAEQLLSATGLGQRIGSPLLLLARRLPLRAAPHAAWESVP